MEKEKYLKALNAIIPLSAGLEAYLRYILKEKIFNNRSRAKLAEGIAGFSLTLLEMGSARIYLDDEELETEHTLLFVEPGHFIPNLESLGASERFVPMIEFLEECRLLGFDQKHLPNLFHLFNEFQIIASKISGQQYDALTMECIKLREESAQYRYSEFCKARRRLLNLCEGKHIANYLGIHPKTLSRLKKEKH